MSREVEAPPEHLSERAQGLWESIADEFLLSPAQYELLRRACEASDRADDALDLLAQDGLTVTDRFEQVKAHPAVAIERDARLAEARLIRELALEPEGPDEPYGRPPRPGTVATGRNGR